VHPDGPFAHEHLGTKFGKTEAWIVVAAEPGARVHVGFKDDVAESTLRDWIDTQDHDAMLDALNPVDVAPGDAIFVPAGVAHAIGEGVLIVELQEPTDLSVLLEWEGFELSEDDGHLNLGWDRALEALDRTAWDAGRLEQLRGPVDGGRVLPAAADPYFRAERLAGGDPLDPGFAVLVAVEGQGTLRTDAGELPLQRGSAVLVPYASGQGELGGDVVALRARPADPGAGEGV
jgi:mannose-6-phosphate isomerase